MADLVARAQSWAGSKISGGFIMRSGYYSGRPPSSSDINTAVLQGIYEGIKNEVGDVEAKNFARFVSDLDDMAASSFVVALIKFLEGGCASSNVEQSTSDRVALDARGDALYAQGLGAIASVSINPVGESDWQDRSMSVKAEFLFIHRDELSHLQKKRLQKRGFARPHEL